MAATTQAPQQRMGRATSQAQMPTGSPAMSRAETLVVTQAETPPTLAETLVVTQVGTLAMSRAGTLAVTPPTPGVTAVATKAMAAATLVVA